MCNHITIPDDGGCKRRRPYALYTILVLVGLLHSLWIRQIVQYLSTCSGRWASDLMLADRKFGQDSGNDGLDEFCRKVNKT